MKHLLWLLILLSGCSNFQASISWTQPDAVTKQLQSVGGENEKTIN